MQIKYLQAVAFDTAKDFTKLWYLFLAVSLWFDAFSYLEIEKDR